MELSKVLDWTKKNWEKMLLWLLGGVVIVIAVSLVVEWVFKEPPLAGRRPFDWDAKRRGWNQRIEQLNMERRTFVGRMAKKPVTRYATLAMRDPFSKLSKFSPVPPPVKPRPKPKPNTKPPPEMFNLVLRGFISHVEENGKVTQKAAIEDTNRDPEGQRTYFVSKRDKVRYGWAVSELDVEKGEVILRKVGKDPVILRLRK